MTRATRPGRLLALTAIAMLGLAGGCAERKNAVAPNLPPETTLFVQGAVDPVNHRVHLYWYGTDPDGDVVGYQYRWRPSSGPADPPWLPIGFCGKPGVCTDSTFTLFTGDSLQISATFEIASIDNDGLVDPSPASQTFTLTNQPPTVTITSRLRLIDTTYASVTLKWDVHDPDGGGPGLRYRVWMDDMSAGYDSTTEQTITVPSTRFLKGGTYTTGYRTVSVQAVDDGGSNGPPDTMSWFVRAPAAVLRNNRGRLLVIDDIPSDGLNNSFYDGFYQGALSPLPAGSWSVLRTEFNPNIFRSARDFAQTLRQFEAVMWYRGQERDIAPLLVTYQDSLGAWLDAGGRLYVDGIYLIEGLNTPGALRSDFLGAHLGSDFMFNSFSNVINDSTAGWSNRGNARTGTLLRSSVYADTVRCIISMPAISGSAPGIRAFGVRDTADVALWAMDGQLSPRNTGYELAVGVTVAQPSGGRLVFISLPLRAGSPTPAGRIFSHILYDPPPIGLIPP